MRVALKVEGFLMLLVRRDGFRCQTDQLGQAQSSVRQRGKSVISGHAVTISYLLLKVFPSSCVTANRFSRWCQVTSDVMGEDDAGWQVRSGQR
jgi:hypothetical protein